MPRRTAAKEPGVDLGQREVDRVVGHHKTKGDIVDQYKIKWKGLGDEFDSWEPLDNVRQSLPAIADYFQNMIRPGRSDVQLKYPVETLRAELSVLDHKVTLELCSKYLTETGHTIVVDERAVEESLTALSRIPVFARDSKMIDEVKSKLQLLEFRRRREEQLALLQTWETDINTVLKAEQATIKLINAVDLDMLDKNFVYVNECVPDCDVVILENNPLACDCRDNCFRDCSCWKGCSMEERPYTRDGILRYGKGAPVYECNKKCKCGPDCGNRVLQRGCTVPLAIFKTGNGTGWGVKTLEPIKKGAFVVEYVGEIVKTDLAELRGRKSDRLGLTYLFDLDFNNKDAPYTIDATVYGNASRFINHACQPNLNVFAVWADCLDADLPRLGFYASRNIKAFEQLSLDYAMEKLSPKRKKKHTPCLCESRNCRKKLF